MILFSLYLSSISLQKLRHTPNGIWLFAFITRRKIYYSIHCHTHDEYYFHVRMWEYVAKCQWFFLISIYTLTCHLLPFQLSLTLALSALAISFISLYVWISVCLCECECGWKTYSCGIFKLYFLNYLLFHRLYVIKIQQNAIIFYILIRIHVCCACACVSVLCVHVFYMYIFHKCSQNIKFRWNIFATTFWPIILPLSLLATLVTWFCRIHKIHHLTLLRHVTKNITACYIENCDVPSEWVREWEFEETGRGG